MTQTKTSADRGSTPLESTTLEEKMKILNNKWFTFLCCAFNLAVGAAAFTTGDWGLFVACSLFAGVTGYSFWLQMGEE